MQKGILRRRYRVDLPLGCQRERRNIPLTPGQHILGWGPTGDHHEQPSPLNNFSFAFSLGRDSVSVKMNFKCVLCEMSWIKGPPYEKIIALCQCYLSTPVNQSLAAVGDLLQASLNFSQELFHPKAISKQCPPLLLLPTESVETHNPGQRGGTNAHKAEVVKGFTCGLTGNLIRIKML